MDDIPKFFEKEEEKILKQVESLHKALMHLRYEGKMLKGQNIKTVQSLTEGLESFLQKHHYLQKEVVFPFLETHIPRHELVISLLEAEHRDIWSHYEKMKKDIQRILKDPDQGIEKKVYENGIYLVTLLRHHIGFEKRNFDHSLRKELREDEKKLIRRRIKDWLEQCDGAILGACHDRL